MPTGFHKQRKLWSGSWTFAPASPSTQTIYIPVYQVRGCPDRLVKKYLNALVMGSTATMRQRMANNGYQIEVCGFSVADGIFYASFRPDHNIFSGFAGATNVGGTNTAIIHGAEDGNNNNYTGSFANVWHEMLWAELGIYFPAGSRPTGHTSDVLISSWSEVTSLVTDSVGNGANSEYATDAANFCNQMRCGQRAEAFPAVSGSLPFNATAAQVKTALQVCATIRTANGVGGTDDVVVTGGPLPMAVSISFSPGQYANTMVGMSLGTSTVSPGSAVLTNTTVGTPAKSGTYGDGTTYSITATNAVWQLTTTGTPTSGSFVLNFLGGIDRMLSVVGPGTNHGVGGTGGAPSDRVTRWLTNVCSANGWTT